ncbi:WxL domain-containing protein [Listeria riparia]|uniref:Legume lectin domain-containing protein n=1 Tax=Listeria riparia FSL S10-1204 TaxID=1265816 RepID=W7CRV4_9LIST|nr:WxL domain-containing protein [Listeria riparia]EUJ42339.1 legume lectin domain-containing protein [Listeria riparia FSL S10-1204]
MTGSIPPGIKYFSNLEILFLYNNRLSGEIPAELGSLSKLERLSIRNNQFTGKIPKELGNLTSIRSELNLASNQLTGEIPPELGNLTNLTGAINLAYNDLTGKIPDSFSNLTKMSNLQLQKTQITGLFPTQLMQSAALTYLDVSYTQIVSPISVPTKGNFTQTISNNQLMISTKPDIYNTFNHAFFKPFDSSSTTHSQLKLINKMEQDKETALYNTHTVQIVDHAQNKIVYDGPLSPSVALELTADTNHFSFYLDGASQNTAATGHVTVISNVVQRADFDNQSWLIDEIERQIPNKKIGTNLTFDDLKQITQIKMNKTVNGYIPAGIEHLSELTNLSLTTMGLTGTIPETIGSLVHLKELNLTGNKLGGEIPSSINKLTDLSTLHLGNNILQGSIPSSLGELKQLDILALNDNQLSGEIPLEIGNLANLTTLYLNTNQLSGEIPTSLGNIASLETAKFDNNQFVGIIPVTLLDIDYLTVTNNQVTLDSATPPSIMTNPVNNEPRYTNTFVTNSKLTGASSIDVTDKTITPFKVSSDTYFDLHYTNNGSTQQKLNDTHLVTIINTTTNQVVYEGKMNPNVSFTHQGSANYQVILDNAPKNTNNIIYITVKNYDLTLASVPSDLNFGTQKITSFTQNYNRTDTDWEIVVHDNRKEKHSWALTATLLTPMKGTNGKTLANGLIFKDKDGIETPLSQQALIVYDYTPTEATTETTKVKWREDEGILLKVHAGEAYAQEYQGQVEWNLIDAP